MTEYQALNPNLNPELYLYISINSIGIVIYESNPNPSRTDHAQVCCAPIAMFILDALAAGEG